MGTIDAEIEAQGIARDLHICVYIMHICLFVGGLPSHPGKRLTHGLTLHSCFATERALKNASTHV